MLAIAAAAAGADSTSEPKPKSDPKPPPATPPPTVDPATARRADRAAQEFLDQQARNQTPAAPEAIADLADAEVLLLECAAFLDAGQSTKAGESFLGAGKKMNGIPADQRRLLGDRYRKASGRLTGLSRRLLGDEAYNPPEEPAEAPVPAPQPAK
ncbi:MAG: hypothetical protein H0W83_03505 [Planctomycetes bacterium]|nr:hypothetical protein [Planctomycetota bacterium]